MNSESDRIKADADFRASVLGASILLVELEREHGEGNWREIAQALALRVKMLEREKGAQDGLPSH